VLESVYSLHEKSVRNDIEIKKEQATIENERKRVESNLNNDADLNNIEGLDEHTKQLVRQLRTKGKLNVTVGSKEDNIDVDKTLKDYKKKLKNQLNTYREFWTSDDLNMITVLDEFGNDRYKMDKQKNEINYIMITLVKDAAYVGKYFDVLSWWRANQKVYPELGVRAAIVLGKPTHNGFQERVFSRGTYQDTKLKKRLKEENFEMSVLNAINNRKVENLKGIMDLGLENLLHEISDVDKEVIQQQQVQEIQHFFEIGDFTDEDDGQQQFKAVENMDDIEHMTEPIKDVNDSDSIYSHLSECLSLDGDDDLSIAQMCHMMHLADEDGDVSDVL
jgi:hypothetical protein